MNRIQSLLTVACLAAVVVALLVWFYPDATFVPTGTNSTNTHAMNLVEVCECNLILYDGVTVETHNTLTGDRKKILQSQVEGAEPGPVIITLSPSGRFSLMFDSTKTHLQIVNNASGIAVRTLDWDPSRFVSYWSWSTDESTLLLSSDLQLQDGAPQTDTAELLVWTSDRTDVLPVTPTSSGNGLFDILSVNNEGTEIIFGQSTSPAVMLFTKKADGSIRQFESSNLVREVFSTTTPFVLTGLNHGRALFALDKRIYIVDLTSMEISILAEERWSDFSFSPISSDNQIIWLERFPGKAFGRVVLFSLETGKTQSLSRFDNGEGLMHSWWLPDGFHLVLRNGFQQRWEIIDTRPTFGQIRVLTIPGISPNDPVAGFVASS